MTQIKTVESIWLAAAILTFEKYNEIENPSMEEMFLKQKDIVKRACVLYGKEVPSTLASSQCVANSNSSKYNYIVGGEGINEKNRRLSYSGEFNGKKERPNLLSEIIVKTNKGDKTLTDIYNFVENEYLKLFYSKARSELLTTTKCTHILEYLDEYAGKPYLALKKARPDERANFNEIKVAGETAVEELDKMARLCEIDFGLKKFGKSNWRDGSNNKVRKYLWRQMKLPGYEDYPTSISLFAEIVEGNKARFRFSVELNENLSEQKDYDLHHRILDRDITLGHDLVYILGGNNSSVPMHQIKESSREVKEKVLNGSYKKIQVSFIITQKDIEEKHYYDKGILNVMLAAIADLMPYYQLVLGDESKRSELQETEKRKENVNMKEIEIDKNIILYGPPGTGKTYNTVNYAVAIIDNEKIDELEKKPYKEVFKRYLELKKSGRIVFTTFHQSYGYEEFIEGIKPVIQRQDDSDSSDVKYEYTDGVFKKFCNNAKQVKVKTSSLGIGENPKVWSILLEGTGLTDLKKECFKNNYIKIGWSNIDKIVTDQTQNLTDKARRIILNFQDEMEEGDIVFIQRDNTSIDAIGIITGSYEFEEEDKEYPRKRNVQWIATEINENVLEINKNTKLDRKSVYPLKKMDLNDVIRLVEKYAKNTEISVEKNVEPYVFIIDEINRGNISKIFGELITLIEDIKRIGESEEASATLPYTGDGFGVPSNVYILGTMNTADRSIALMDTALRRRLKFVEMMPKSSIIKKMNLPDIEGINIVKMLDTINERIEYLFDREHTIGHAYFTILTEEATLDKLARIFKNAIIPLLQEYFYEDYSRIQLVLGDNAKKDEYKFILDTDVKVKDVFKGNPDVDLPEKKYSIQDSAFYEAESYKQIY